MCKISERDQRILVATFIPRLGKQTFSVPARSASAIRNKAAG